MSEHDNGDIFRLADLPIQDISAKSRENIRAAAHAELHAAMKPKSTFATVRRIYRRAEPVLVSALAASYLFWAFGSVLP
jgi:hypothetical protein